ncbi:vacuolar protein sorting-associated protein 72 homolog, partial [Manacus vitellinus]|uniref:vacuolar protein sorting-associated protein 72 homolog n=1 Tax=Manacus vitellinus TaxID=328815 RepID=UPI00115EDF91
SIPVIPQESGDDEYRGEHSDTEDEVDSDFDIDEGDEPGSDQDEAEPRRRRRVLTKAYREPLKSLRPKKPEGPRGGSQKPREVKSIPLELQDDVGDSRKHMRQSTTEHTRQTFLRLQERQVQSKRKKGGTSYERPLTQEELLEEAKITEEINLRSLENYERLEADKKKQVQKKRQCVGPVIRYLSLAMPVIPEPPRHLLDVEGSVGTPPCDSWGGSSPEGKGGEGGKAPERARVPTFRLSPCPHPRCPRSRCPRVPIPGVPVSPSLVSPCPGKPFVPKNPTREIPREEQITLEPELEEALANATEAEMCDLAAILGMYTLMSNKQYYDAICSGNISNTEGINSE